ncbi:MAG: PIN domain-containing protein [Syntrophobacteraceae bacterium]|jgi:hypothetical protein
MTYVFDTSSFIVLGHFFPERFPSFWELFDSEVSNGRIVSVREVYLELDNQISRPHLREWVDRNKHIFLTPGPAESAFLAEIFAISHFRQLLSQKQILKATPVADPFIIASAKIRGACVVTEEVAKKNAAKIPNVCEHFGVSCTNIEGFMQREKWKF